MSALIHLVARPARSLAALALAASLVACGGGGGGGGPAVSLTAGPAVTVSGSNYAAVGGETVAGIQMALSGPPGNPIAGAQVSSDGAALRLVLRRLPGLLAVVSRQPAVVVGAVISLPTQGCTFGGTISISFNDANNNANQFQVFDAGDSVTLRFSSCSEGEGVVNGTMVLTMNTTPTNLELVGVYPVVMDITFGMSNLSVASTTSTQTLHGTLRMESNITSLSDSVSRFRTAGLSASVQAGGATRTRLLTNLDATATTVAGVETDTFTATVTSSVLGGGSAVVTTTTPFVVPLGGTYPTSGASLATGANGGKVVMTALPDGVNLQLELDANGDGTVESTSSVTWGSLF